MTDDRLHPEGAPGEQEMLARSFFGDERYEAMKKAESTHLLAQRGKAMAEWDLSKAQVAYVTAKTSFWQTLAFAIVVAVIFGTTLAIMEMVR